MSVNVIDAKTLSKMFLTGAKSLEAKKEWINELNVFPVPDGDTGTNMTMTIMSAAKEVAAMDEITMEPLCKAISSGSLRGARGNSGVILSQLLRGFTKSIKTLDTVDVIALAQAFQKATDTAYKAVMKPKEGTILTVAKGAADKAMELAYSVEDMSTFIDEVIKHAEYVLSKTPDMLPVLKQAGVLDSGGQGLVEIMKGAYQAFLGNEIAFDTETIEGEVSTAKSLDFQANIEIKYGYCTEFIVILDKVFNAKNEQDFKNFLESIGDSVVCVAADDVVKVHVHTNDPGLALQKGLSFGSLSRIKIDNMREEQQEKIAELSKKSEVKPQAVETKEEPKAENAANVYKNPSAGEKKEFGFIAVSCGEGLDSIFTGLGVDCIISGGQTMNPSTEDMVNSAESINASTIFILPNNKNIVMAANQVQYMVEDKNIIVIPTKTVPQGITALINFVSGASAEDNEAAMKDSISLVKTGQVTYAVRDTVINDFEIKQGNIMGIGDHEILAVGDKVEETTMEMLDNMVDDDSELISIYYGAETDEQTAGELAKAVEEKYSDCDVEIHYGGQPIYYYMVSVE